MHHIVPLFIELGYICALLPFNKDQQLITCWAFSNVFEPRMSDIVILILYVADIPKRMSLKGSFNTATYTVFF